MRAFLFLVLVLQMMLEGVAPASNISQHQEVRLIRRAYLDVTGLLPTASEIDWYVVYNKDGYKMAIKYLTERYTTTLTADYLLSNEYITQSPVLIPAVQLKRSVLYLAGLQESSMDIEQAFHRGKQRLIEHALTCTLSLDEAIDYLCNMLMSRVSNAQENNMLVRKFNDVEALSNEHRAWMVVIDEILKLPDVATK